MATQESTPIGSVFGLLTIVGFVDRPFPSGGRRAICLCSCGTEKIIRLANLKTRSGRPTLSCGCHARKTWGQNLPEAPIRHGLARTAGGRKRHYLYNVWRGMRGRCYNPANAAFHNYGGRGITVCAEWRASFEAFLGYARTVLGPRPSGCSLDRIDNNAGYEPGNVRWASAEQQRGNTWRSVDWSRSPKKRASLSQRNAQGRFTLEIGEATKLTIGENL